MNTKGKADYIANSMASLYKKQGKIMEKRHKNRIRELIYTDRFEEVKTVYDKMAEEVMESFIKLENSKHEELDGMSFPEYFGSIDDINVFIEISSAVFSTEDSAFPSSLTKKLESLDDTMKDQLYNYVAGIDTEANTTMSPEQRAAVRICSFAGSDRIVDLLIKHITHLHEDAEYEDYECLTDTLIIIGQPALEPLMKAVESLTADNRAYGFILQAIGAIGAGNPSDSIYRFLRDKFRSSDKRIAEANALAAYGDGRAIYAIKSYIEKNKDVIEPWDYLGFRDVIHELGGDDMEELDEFFGIYDESEDIEYEDIEE